LDLAQPEDVIDNVGNTTSVLLYFVPAAERIDRKWRERESRCGVEDGWLCDSRVKASGVGKRTMEIQDQCGSVRSGKLDQDILGRDRFPLSGYA